MSKRSFVNPFVLLDLDISGDGNDVVEGGGTGQGATPTLNPQPCNFQAWLINYASNDWDADGSGDYDVNEFLDWWSTYIGDDEASLEAWLACGNSQADWDNYWG